MLKVLLLIALLCSATSRAQSIAVADIKDNSELTEVFTEDQRVRQPKALGPDEPQIVRTDADRLALVKQMLANDRVNTSTDYLHAALVLQHSPDNADYLVAHTLAVVCAADHNRTCLWLSAATLDRYLQSIGRPQIYGTQYLNFDHPPVTQQPYATDLISDSLRKRLGVPPRSKQDEQLKAYQQQVMASPKKHP